MLIRVYSFFLFILILNALKKKYFFDTNLNLEIYKNDLNSYFVSFLRLINIINLDFFLMNFQIQIFVLIIIIIFFVFFLKFLKLYFLNLIASFKNKKMYFKQSQNFLRNVYCPKKVSSNKVNSKSKFFFLYSSFNFNINYVNFIIPEIFSNKDLKDSKTLALLQFLKFSLKNNIDFSKRLLNFFENDTYLVKKRRLNYYNLLLIHFLILKLQRSELISSLNLTKKVGNYPFSLAYDEEVINFRRSKYFDYTSTELFFLLLYGLLEWILAFYLIHLGLCLFYDFDISQLFFSMLENFLPVYFHPYLGYVKISILVNGIFFFFLLVYTLHDWVIELTDEVSTYQLPPKDWFVDVFLPSLQALFLIGMFMIILFLFFYNGWGFLLILLYYPFEYFYNFTGGLFINIENLVALFVTFDFNIFLKLFLLEKPGIISQFYSPFFSKNSIFYKSFYDKNFLFNFNNIFLNKNNLKQNDSFFFSLEYQYLLELKIWKNELLQDIRKYNVFIHQMDDFFFSKHLINKGFRGTGLRLDNQYFSNQIKLFTSGQIRHFRPNSEQLLDPILTSKFQNAFSKSSTNFTNFVLLPSENQMNSSLFQTNLKTDKIKLLSQNLSFFSQYNKYINYIFDNDLIKYSYRVFCNFFSFELYYKFTNTSNLYSLDSNDLLNFKIRSKFLYNDINFDNYSVNFSEINNSNNSTIVNSVLLRNTILLNGEFLPNVLEEHYDDLINLNLKLLNINSDGLTFHSLTQLRNYIKETIIIGNAFESLKKQSYNNYEELLEFSSFKKFSEENFNNLKKFFANDKNLVSLILFNIEFLIQKQNTNNELYFDQISILTKILNNIKRNNNFLNINFFKISIHDDFIYPFLNVFFKPFYFVRQIDMVEILPRFDSTNSSYYYQYFENDLSYWWDTYFIFKNRLFKFFSNYPANFSFFNRKNIIYLTNFGEKIVYKNNILLNKENLLEILNFNFSSYYNMEVKIQNFAFFQNTIWDRYFHRYFDSTIITEKNEPFLDYYARDSEAKLVFVPTEKRNFSRFAQLVYFLNWKNLKDLWLEFPQQNYVLPYVQYGLHLNNYYDYFKLEYDYSSVISDYETDDLFLGLRYPVFLDRPEFISEEDENVSSFIIDRDLLRSYQIGDYSGLLLLKDYQSSLFYDKKNFILNNYLYNLVLDKFFFMDENYFWSFYENFFNKFEILKKKFYYFSVNDYFKNKFFYDNKIVDLNFLDFSVDLYFKISKKKIINYNLVENDSYFWGMFLKNKDFFLFNAVDIEENFKTSKFFLDLKGFNTINILNFNKKIDYLEILFFNQEFNTKFFIKKKKLSLSFLNYIVQDKFFLKYISNYNNNVNKIFIPCLTTNDIYYLKNIFSFFNLLPKQEELNGIFERINIRLMDFIERIEIKKNFKYSDKIIFNDYVLFLNLKNFIKLRGLDPWNTYLFNENINIYDSLICNTEFLFPDLFYDELIQSSEDKLIELERISFLITPYRLDYPIKGFSLLDKDISNNNFKKIISFYLNSENFLDLELKLINKDLENILIDYIFNEYVVKLNSELTDYYAYELNVMEVPDDIPKNLETNQKIFAQPSSRNYLLKSKLFKDIYFKYKINPYFFGMYNFPYNNEYSNIWVKSFHNLLLTNQVVDKLKSDRIFGKEIISNQYIYKRIYFLKFFEMFDQINDKNLTYFEHFKLNFEFIFKLHQLGNSEYYLPEIQSNNYSFINNNDFSEIIDNEILNFIKTFNTITYFLNEFDLLDQLNNVVPNIFDLFYFDISTPTFDWFVNDEWVSKRFRKYGFRLFKTYRTFYKKDERFDKLDFLDRSYIRKLQNFFFLEKQITKRRKFLKQSYVYRSHKLLIYKFIPDAGSKSPVYLDLVYRWFFVTNKIKPSPLILIFKNNEIRASKLKNYLIFLQMLSNSTKTNSGNLFWSYFLSKHNIFKSNGNFIQEYDNNFFVQNYGNLLFFKKDLQTDLFFFSSNRYFRSFFRILLFNNKLNLQINNKIEFLSNLKFFDKYYEYFFDFDLLKKKKLDQFKYLSRFLILNDLTKKHLNFYTDKEYLIYKQDKWDLWLKFNKFRNIEDHYIQYNLSNDKSFKYYSNETFDLNIKEIEEINLENTPFVSNSPARNKMRNDNLVDDLPVELANPPKYYVPYNHHLWYYTNLVANYPLNIQNIKFYSFYADYYDLIVMQTFKVLKRKILYDLFQLQKVYYINDILYNYSYSNVNEENLLNIYHPKIISSSSIFYYLTFFFNFIYYQFTKFFYLVYKDAYIFMILLLIIDKIPLLGHLLMIILKFFMSFFFFFFIVLKNLYTPFFLIFMI